MPMCGFFTAISNTKYNESSLSILKKSASKIAHRGPDSKSDYKENGIYNLFYRLSIRDLSNDSVQPILSKCERYLMSFNGEIYSVNGSLKNNPEKFKSDTIFLINQISEHGIEIIKNIRGMYAISLFDRLSKCVYFIRDPFGIKPLFYSNNIKIPSHKDKIFVACSEQSPILNLLKDFNEDYLQSLRFLRMGLSFDLDNTFFREIKQVKPGYILKFSLEEFKLSEERLPSHLNTIDLSPKETFDFSNHNNDLKKIVHDHLISDVEVASTLSGGIDSTYISIAASEYSSRKLNSYTLDTDFIKCELNDELINKMKGLEIQKVEDNTNDYHENFVSKIKLLSSPLRTSAWLMQDLIFKKIATNSKAKVLLVGEGADELYSGYERLINPYLYCLELDNEFTLFEETIRNISTFTNLNYLTNLNNYKDYKNKLDSETDYNDMKFWKYLNDDSLNNIERNFLGKNDFKKLNYESEVIYKTHLKNYFTRSLIPSDLITLDHLSMSNGLELRVPFIDYELFNKVMKFSYREHFKFGFNKYMLRKVSLNTPTEIRWNKKKSRRPNINTILIYDFFADKFLDLLKEEHHLIKTNLARKDFERDLLKRNSNSSHFWFRVFSYMSFFKIFFGD